jgi:uncharacterized protein (TIGR01777 family)
VRVVISGAGGLIGTRLARSLRERGSEVTGLTRSPSAERRELRWDAARELAPREALEGSDAVVHLAGANIAQRWSEGARAEIRDSRLRGTANLVAAIAACERPPRVLLSASAVGYYGDRGDQPLTEDSPPGSDWLATLCVAWEQEALAAREHGLRVCTLRTGVVLDRRGGALARMLPPFRLGVGGPIAGGRQYLSWIGADDVVGLYSTALEDDRYEGAVNATAPTPVRNADFARALGRVLHRPAIAPVPALALRLLYGDMAEIVTASTNVLPARALALGYQFETASLDAALRAALA